MAVDRARARIIVLSLASLPFMLPHVIEDFAAGIAGRIGLSTATGAVLLGGFLALQSLGLILITRGRQLGLVITFWVGVIWAAGALVDHGPALLSGEFRSGVSSVVWVVGLMLTQAAAAALAAREAWGRAARRPPPPSGPPTCFA